MYGEIRRTNLITNSVISTLSSGKWEFPSTCSAVLFGIKKVPRDLTLERPDSQSHTGSYFHKVRRMFLGG